MTGLPEQKTWIIAAKIGHDVALKTLSRAYGAGIASKEDFLWTL